MIISHKNNFIFVKTGKTAGTSIEIYLSQFCGPKDIITPIYPEPEEDFHEPRNWQGLFNPFPEIMCDKHPRSVKETFQELFNLKRFYPHIHARIIKSRIPSRIWKNYFTFTIERNPWDRTVSVYYFNRGMGFTEKAWPDFVQGRNFLVNYPRYTGCNREEVIVDKIIYFENLPDNVPDLLRQIGIRIKVINDQKPLDEIKTKSSYRPEGTAYQEMYTDTQKEIVEEKCKKEIELHSYKF